METYRVEERGRERERGEKRKREIGQTHTSPTD